MTADTVGGVFSYAVELALALAQHDVRVHLATMGARVKDHQLAQLRDIPGLMLHDSGYALEWMPEPWDDADRVGQVLTNYLTNALKYSHADRPVTVSARVRGLRARVEVRDEGPGLTAAQRRHLFERFHRVQGIDVVSGSGIGLGLYISKTIAQHHGGSVGVTSAPGKGSTFWFELPLASAGDS